MRIIDLSQPLYPDMPVYPGDPAVGMPVVHTMESHGWVLRELTMGSHTGTHVDAFAHMVEDGAALDDIPLERFCGKAIAIGPEDDIPDRSGVILVEGEVDAALAARLKRAGSDFIAIGEKAELSEDMQRQLLADGILTFTDLVNTDALPRGQEFLFIGLPLKIRNGDGSPIRAVALLDY
ncbi:cyclase family protein [Aestuariispira ectoiniformans]|uniref:cyclase family protein n=1 Tax=Aestuariispira ectoiniformans TaxID=2775080 RepID=UPI00223AD628|nr:cyclase family protein [Aestuariispira ectoiniformans]